jgi:hypothetical protein
MLLAAVALAGCGAASGAGQPVRAAFKLARWQPWGASVNTPLDLQSTGSSAVLEADGRLALVSPSGMVAPIETEYVSPGGEEPYIAVSNGGCFRAGIVYAIRLVKPRGILRIGHGPVTRLASIAAPGLIDGIAFDTTGGFGGRLLVTVDHGQTTTIDSIGCRGDVRTLTTTAPRVEGGIVVAPKSFGRFAGDLIAPDEIGGRVFAIAPDGRSAVVADSGLPHGQDIGVESEAFVPPGRGESALLADRLTPGNRHPGDNVLLRLSAAALRAVGVRPGELLVATEGGAETDAISCGAASCTVRHVADGPSEAHAEGHIAFVG